MEIAYNATTEEIIEAPNQMSAARLAELGLSTMEAPADFNPAKREDYKVEGGVVGHHPKPDGVFVEPTWDTATGAWIEDLAEALFAAKGILRAVINKFIEQKPDSTPRYDEALKLDAVNAKFTAVAAGGSIPQPVADAEAWIRTVQAEYYTKKAALEAAAAISITELAAVDLTYGGLEARFGVSGTELPDPDIKTADLLS